MNIMYMNYSYFCDGWGGGLQYPRPLTPHRALRSRGTFNTYLMVLWSSISAWCNCLHLWCGQILVRPALMTISSDLLAVV